MAGTNVGTAYITIVPSFKGGVKSINSQLQSGIDGNSIGTKLSSSVSGSFSKSFGKAMSGTLSSVTKSFSGAFSNIAKLGEKSATASVSDIGKILAGAASQAGNGIVSGLSSAFDAVQSKAATVLDSVTTKLKAAGAAATAAAGITVKSGAEAFDTWSQFGNTMRFAGFDDSYIQGMSDELTDYTKQTVYNLSDVLNTSAQLGANGVKDFDKITMGLGNINAAAGGTATSFGLAAAQLVQMNSLGTVQWADWKVFSQDLPGAAGAIEQQLADMGAYTGNFAEAVQNGEISADEFDQALIALGSTDAAVAATSQISTFTAAIGEMQDTLSMDVGGLLQQVFNTDVLTNITGKVTGVIDSVTGFISDHLGQIKAVASTIWGTLSGIGSNISMYVSEHWGSISGVLSQAGQFVLNVFGSISSAVSANWGTISRILNMAGATISSVVGFLSAHVDTIGRVFSALVTIVASVFGAVRTVLSSNQGAVSGFVDGVVNAINRVSDWISTHGPQITLFLVSAMQLASQMSPVIVGLVGTFAVVGKVAPVITSIAQGFSNLSLVVTTVKGVMSGLGGAFTVVRGAMSGLAGTFTALTGPVGIVIGVIGALVAAFVTLFNTNQGFHDAVIGIWDSICSFFQSAGATISGIFSTLVSFISGIPGSIAGFFSGIGERISGFFSGIPGAVSGFFSNVVGFVQGVPGKIAGFFSGIGDKVSGFFSGIPDKVGGLFDNVVSTVQGIPGEIVGFFSGIGSRITSAIGSIHFPAPHVSWEGVNILGKSISLPHISWYAKGGFFDGATVLSGVGEAGTELAWPSYGRYFDRYAKGIAQHMPEVRGGDTYVFNIGDMTFNDDDHMRDVAFDFAQGIVRKAGVV